MHFSHRQLLVHGGDIGIGITFFCNNSKNQYNNKQINVTF